MSYPIFKLLYNRVKIRDLETDKRELIGVFGKTGAGKSSLINAIIEEKNLLPSGSVSACTTVMIKVEANMHNQKYEADIEFITKEVNWAKYVHMQLVKMYVAGYITCYLIKLNM